MSENDPESGTEFVRLLGSAAGIDIAPESEPVLASLLSQYTDAIRAIPLKEMLDVDPGIIFDPSWDDLSE